MDTKGLRKLYGEKLRQSLDTVGGKTRKRTFTRIERAVAEHRGEALTAPDEAVLVWSDLHLGHANIIEYQALPFFDVGDMDEEIWRTWERVLQPESVLVLVLVLVGDVAMGDAVCEASWERIRRTLSANIVDTPATLEIGGGRWSCVSLNCFTHRPEEAWRQGQKRPWWQWTGGG